MVRVEPKANDVKEVGKKPAADLPEGPQELIISKKQEEPPSEAPHQSTTQSQSLGPEPIAKEAFLETPESGLLSHITCTEFSV
jgi:hypothetical protein